MTALDAHHWEVLIEFRDDRPLDRVYHGRGLLDAIFAAKDAMYQYSEHEIATIVIRPSND